MQVGRRRLLRGGLALAGAGLIGGCGVPPQAQAPSKVARIGYLGLGPRAATGALADTFEQELRDLGYVDGRTVTLEWRWAEGRDELLPALAAELVSLRVDVLVASGPRTIPPAKQATDSIPIVMVAGSADPVGLGLVDSLAKPGGNLTGTITAPPEGLLAKALELLTAAATGAARVAVLWDPNNSPGPFRSAAAARQLDAGASRLGVRLQPYEAGDPTELEPALEAAVRDGAGALLVQGSPMHFAERARIAGLALKARLPASTFWREFAEAGGMLAYGPNVPDLFRRGAYYVDRILRGARPADLPVEQPTTFDFVINLKTAQTLGLSIPESLLQQATEVIR